MDKCIVCKKELPLFKKPEDYVYLCSDTCFEVAMKKQKEMPDPITKELKDLIVECEDMLATIEDPKYGVLSLNEGDRSFLLKQMANEIERLIEAYVRQRG